MDTHLLPPDHPAQRLVRELARVGVALMDSLAALVEEYEEQAKCDGLEAAETVLAMTAGSVEPALRSLDPDDVERTIELVGAVYDRFLSDLRLGAEIAKRRESMRS